MKKTDRGIDIPFLIIIILMLAGGMIMVFSVSPPRALNDGYSKYYYIIRHLVFCLVGICFMLFAATIDYQQLKKFAVPVCIAVFLLNVAVPFVGVEVNGAKRWLGIGPVQFQPSEIGKFAILFYLACVISNFSDKRLSSFKTGYLPLFLSLCMFLGCFVLQKHLSATVVTFAAGILVMTVAGVRFAYILGTGLLGAVGLGALAVLEPFRMQRLMSFQDPFKYPTGEGYQAIQSLYAIGSGGAFGRGLGQSRQKFLHLPEAHNDYIFSIICEELGFVGGTAVMLLFMIFVYRGLTIAIKAKDTFGTLVAFGFVSLLGLQMLINVGVVTSTIPSTGMQLPFFSYGGTSLIIILTAMGVVLNISKKADL